MQRIGCRKLDPARDFSPGRDAAANARVGRQRKGRKAFRRQKLDLGTQLARIGGERLQAPYDPVDLRRPCVGSDQYSHRARAAQNGSRISGLPIRMTARSCTDSQRANPLRCKYDDGRSVLEPSHFLPFAEGGPAGNFGFPAVLHVQQDVQKMQADAGDENRGNRHQGNHDPGRAEYRANDCALVLAEQLGNAVERDRIDVPRVAGNVGDLVDGAVVRRMKAMVHAGRQPQRDVLAIAIEFDELRVDQQILQRVRRSLGLDQLVPVDPSAGADDAITGAG